jgi:hypothetical protein
MSLSNSASPFAASRPTVAVVPGALLMGAAGRGGGAPSASDEPAAPGTTGSGIEALDQHVDFAEFTLTEGSAPPPGQPPASDDDGDCGTPGAP